MASIKIASNHAASHVLWYAKRQELAAATHTPVESSIHSANQFV